MERGTSRLLGILASRRVLGPLSAALILAGAFFYTEARDSSAAFTPVSFGMAGAPPTVGSAAPDFTLRDLSGAPVRLSDYRGRPVWINFWATWCPPCRAELPDIAAVYQEMNGKGLVLLAISVSEEASTVRNYLAKTGFDVPAVLDEGGNVAAQYGLSGFPTHVFIDSEGIVRDIRVGGLNQSATRERLAQILPP